MLGKHIHITSLICWHVLTQYFIVVVVNLVNYSRSFSPVYQVTNEVMWLGCVVHQQLIPQRYSLQKQYLDFHSQGVNSEHCECASHHIDAIVFIVKPCCQTGRLPCQLSTALFVYMCVRQKQNCPEKWAHLSRPHILPCSLLGVSAFGMRRISSNTGLRLGISSSNTEANLGETCLCHL